jgi:hypothetical protein
VPTQRDRGKGGGGGGSGSGGRGGGRGREPELDLAQLMDQHLGAEGGDHLINGPAAHQIHNITGHETITSPLVAATFWQAFVYSDVFKKIYRSLSGSALSPTHKAARTDIIVVRHGGGWPRQDLLILDPRYSQAAPTAITAEATPRELEVGSERFQRWLEASSTTARMSKVLSDELLGPLIQSSPSLAAEAATTGRFRFLVAKKPPVIPTALAPENPVGVGPSMRSVGAWGMDSSGREGATTALHDLLKKGSAIGMTLSVGSATGTVIAEDVVSDSCFVEVVKPFAGGRTVKPFRGTLPPLYAPFFFAGVGTKKRASTLFQGNTFELPFWTAGVQSRVFTPPHTVPGDSGAALVDQSGDLVLGFSQNRSGFGAPNAHSGWIWAEAVFEAYGLV